MLETMYSTSFPLCCFSYVYSANCSWSFVYCVIILCVSLLPHVYYFIVCIADLHT